MATALLGGVGLGVAASGRLLLTGRVLGVSGIVRGTLLNQVTTWRMLFTAGLALGAFLAVRAAPQAFDVLPQSYTVGRAALGGALVGVGSSMGNGCTSGHGIWCAIWVKGVLSGAGLTALWVLSGCRAFMGSECGRKYSRWKGMHCPTGSHEAVHVPRPIRVPLST
jgi:uncharacterized membrane protein YedE/YeeE